MPFGEQINVFDVFASIPELAAEFVETSDAHSRLIC